MTSSNEMKRLASLWMQAQPAVASFISASVRRFQDAEDLLQDVAVDVAGSFEKYDSERPFLPWAIAIARFKVLDYYRRQGKSQKVFSVEAIDMLADASVRVGHHDPNAHEVLRRCINGLTKRARDIVRLRYASDLRPKDIAHMIGGTAGGVSKLLSRSRAALAECMKRRLGREIQ